MKKVMLSAAVCAMAFSANADVSEEVVVEETAQTSDFNSFYFGAGIGGSFLKSDDIEILKEASLVARGVNVRPGQDIEPTGFAGYKKTRKFGVKANRLVGSLVFGAGKVFSNNVYVGAEFLVDITKNKKISQESNVEKRSDVLVVMNAGGEDQLAGVRQKVKELLDKETPDAVKGEVKIGGFVPQLNLKAGYVFKNNTLVYGKLGCAWTKVSIDSYYKKSGSDEWTKNEDESFSKTKPSLILGLGAEKSFGKKFSAAVEADYNFGWKHKGYKANKGWNVRALVKYNVKY
ncbi:MAG: hypothetical protein J6P84_01605 [Alphaproteobacteria bacterium]|nr:hypothetical protein [Alphaproteobacteria bacterium]MBO7641579.1 hypothetical protein [Alphaproteobacteria bacterium]